MKICVLSVSTGNYEGEKLLPKKFMEGLQLVEDAGGSIVGLTSLSMRYRGAIVKIPDHLFDSNPRLFKEY
jgi:hypothetical protein